MSVALLFLTYGNIVHRNHPTMKKYLDHCRVFIHPKNESAVDSSLRPNVISPQIPTQWGDASIVIATINLLYNAFRDTTVQYFVLCSEDMFPLRDYDEYQTFLEGQQHSLFSLMGGSDRRIKDDFMSKTHQWWVLIRKDVEFLLKELKLVKPVSNFLEHVSNHRAFKLIVSKIPPKVAVDEYFFLSFFKRYYEDYQFTEYKNCFVKWHEEWVSKHPTIFNRLLPSDTIAIRRERSFFIRKTLSTFEPVEIRPKSKGIIFRITEENIGTLRLPKEKSVDLFILSTVSNLSLLSEEIKSHCVQIYFTVYNMLDIATDAMIRKLKEQDGYKEIKVAEDVEATGTARIAIIIPFRDIEKEQKRTAQLREFVDYMKDYLDGHDYKIFLTEQTDDNRKFNRGQLLNIGFERASKEGYTNFVFHDVDLLPSIELREYYTNVPIDRPVHIAAVWDRYGSNPKYFGGITAFNEEMYRRMNGYPNNFWGWGGEDDELYLRAIKFYKIFKVNKGNIRDLEDLTIQQKMEYLKENDLKFMLKKEALAQHDATWETNGLSSLQYNLKNESSCGEHCERITVELDNIGNPDAYTGEMKVEKVKVEREEEKAEKVGKEEKKEREKKDSTQKILSTFEEAYEVAKKYVKHIPKKIQAPRPIVPDYYSLPPEVNASIWEMSQDAVKNTLSYILEYLNHSCYMLCVHHNKGRIYKLERKVTAEVYRPIIERAIRDVNNNRKITAEQKRFVQDRLKTDGELRFMQCVVKEFNPKKETSASEYVDFIQGLKLPDGVYILNLTDAVILRKDGMHPFPMVTGRLLDIGKYKSKPFIPIFSISGQKGYYDIPIPNYDDVMYVLGKTNIDMTTFQTDWTKKRPLAVFRGGPTGCGYTTETNQRLRLTTIKSKMLDVEISGKGATIDTNSVRFDPIYGIGMLNTGIKPATRFLTMGKQSEYKYIIHIDGNVNAYRLLTTMSTGSLILRVESDYTSWLDHVLQPNVHYIPVKSDLSDLLKRIDDCEKNDRRCREIANNAMNLARDVLQFKNLRGIFQYIIQNVSCVLPKIEYSSKIENEDILPILQKAPPVENDDPNRITAIELVPVRNVREIRKEDIRPSQYRLSYVNEKKLLDFLREKYSGLSIVCAWYGLDTQYGITESPKIMDTNPRETARRGILEETNIDVPLSYIQSFGDIFVSHKKKGNVRTQFFIVDLEEAGENVQTNIHLGKTSSGKDDDDKSEDAVKVLIAIVGKQSRLIELLSRATPDDEIHGYHIVPIMNSLMDDFIAPVHRGQPIAEPVAQVEDIIAPVLIKQPRTPAGPPPRTPDVSPPKMKPKTPEGSPPKIKPTTPEGFPIKEPSPIPPTIISPPKSPKVVKRESPVKKESPEVFSIPEGKKICPRGSKKIMVNKVPKCKKITLKVKEEKEPSPTPVIIPVPVKEPSPTPVIIPVKEPSPTPVIKSPKVIKRESPEVFSIPEGKKICPRGSKKIMVNKVPKCKKITLKVKEEKQPSPITIPVPVKEPSPTPVIKSPKVIKKESPVKKESPEVFSIPEGKKICPRGSKKIKVNDVFKCKKITLKVKGVKEEEPEKTSPVKEIISSVTEITEIPKIKIKLKPNTKPNLIVVQSPEPILPKHHQPENHIDPKLIRERLQLAVPNTERFPWLRSSYNLMDLVSRILSEIPTKSVIDDHRVTFTLRDDTPSLVTRAIQEEEILKTHLKHRRPNGDIVDMASFWDVWQKNPELRDEIITNKDPIEAVWQLARKYDYKLATTFMPGYAKALYDAFNAKKVLDPCAGWGDRLLGAACSSVVSKYVAFDPNHNLRPGYAEILSLRGVQTARIEADHLYFDNGFEIHSQPFEIGARNLESDSFDLAFTSPPFFDYEMYNPDNPEYRDWISEFYVPLFQQTCRVLKDGHYFGIHIGDTTAGKISDFLFNDVHKVSGFVYDFKIGLMGMQSGKNRTVYMYRKVANRGPVPRDLLTSALLPAPVFRKAVEIPRDIRKICNPPVMVQTVKDAGRKFEVFQDYQCVGGSKQRLIGLLMSQIQQREIVYAGPEQGMAQVALALGGHLWKKKATVFLNTFIGVREKPILTRLAMAMGANIEFTRNPRGRTLKDTEDDARAYCDKDPTNRFLVPFGLKDEPGSVLFETFKRAIMEALGERVRNAPRRLWIVAGSSFLVTVLNSIWPETEFHIVQVGKTVYDDQLIAIRHVKYKSEYRFAENTEVLPPYQSIPWYDAKLWKLVKEHGQDGDCIWNVAGLPSENEIRILQQNRNNVERVQEARRRG